MAKMRLDRLMVERGLAQTRSQAQRMIMAGDALVDGQPVLQAGAPVKEEAAVSLKNPPRFVSRGGEKLAAALDGFGVEPVGWTCADVGASTGGFTDCLLQRGARRVFAIDVGKGILHWRLRNDPRVTVMEETNARFLETLDERVDLATIDASFISLRLLLPAVVRWLQPEGRIVALIKPQFEAGKGSVGKGGVVRDPEIHRRVLREAMTFAAGQGLSAHGLLQSPLRGPAGNIEFLALWMRSATAFDWEEWIQTCAPDSGS